MQQWEQAIDAFIAQNKQNILRDIGRLVAVPSVQGEPAPGAPFGAGPKAALKKALEIAGELGLAVHNCEDKIGWAELPGAEPGSYIATITHLDVVPAGNGWDADPFVMREREGWILGRGVADDKGPTVLCLYALRFLQEQGLPLRYGVRALLGTNEETGMADVDYYLGHYPAPAFCFSPDAEFPVCNGEKGHYGANLVSPVCAGDILGFAGGVAPNAVPDEASALVRADLAALQPAPGITLSAEGGAVRVSGHGKAGHAAMPEGTVNAIGLVVNYLLENGIGNEAERACLAVLQKLHAATDGSALGIAADDGRFSPLTIIGGTIRTEGGRIIQSVDSRYPTNTNADTLTRRLAAAAGSAMTVEDVHTNVPFYIEPDTAPIRTLIDTYNEVTGESAKPFTMGGGTYARHFPLAVSFGPERQGLALPGFAGPMHGANEGAEIHALLQALKIYILALSRLQALEL